MNIESLNKVELEKVCKTLKINTVKKTKEELLELYYQEEKIRIDEIKKNGKEYEWLKEEIKRVSKEYSNTLGYKIRERTEEMKKDSNEHYLIYEILGISKEEGIKIDLYQNTGRFLYKYAGAFLEEITIMCFKLKDSNAKKIRIQNTIGKKPVTFEIDCLLNNNAYEIKWRDSTTDGDHITKEHTRVQNIKKAGYKPVRIMFYYPNRDQAQKIQSALKAIYETKEIGGLYYSGEEAWEYVAEETGIDLKKILEEIAIENREKRKENE